MSHVVAIVPAYNAADTVGATVTALRTIDDVVEVVVVDDGSGDHTTEEASAAGARVVELARNRGKGAAVAAGIAASGAPEMYLLIDADLGESAAAADALLGPAIAGEADMTIAVFAARDGDDGDATGADATGPAAEPRRGGFGIVKRLAAHILRVETGRNFAEPLSGQRAVRGALLRSLDLADGFGLEIGLTLDVAARDAAIVEIELPLVHRPTGRDLSGIAHRARIGRDVLRAASARTGTLTLALRVVGAVIGRCRPLVGAKRAARIGTSQRVLRARRGARRRSPIRDALSAPLAVVQRRIRRRGSRDS